MRISFDYWGTLTLSVWQKEAKKLLIQNEVFIVTRGKYMDKAREIADLVGIKQKNVISTEGQDKGPILETLSIDVHHDDDAEQIARIEAVNKKVFCIRVNLEGKRH